MLTVDKKDIIGPSQFVGLLTLSRIIPVTVGFPLLTATEKPQDAWVASLLGTLVSVPVVLAITGLSLRHPGRTVIQYSQDLLGPVFGKLIGLTLTAYWFMTAADVARALGEAFVEGAMPETPLVAFLIVACAAGAATARCGIEVIARMAEIVAYGAILLLLPIPLLAHDVVKFDNLRPFLAGGIAGLVRPASVAVAFFVQFMVAGMLVPHLNRPERAPAFAFYSVLVSGFVLVWVSAVLVMIFGSRASALFLPAYALGRVISIAQSVERVDVVILALLTVGSLLKIALFLWATAVALQQMLGLEEGRCLFYPLASLAVSLGVLAFKDYLEFVRFFIRSWPVYSLMLGTTVTGVLGLASLVRGRTIRRQGR